MKRLILILGLLLFAVPAHAVISNVNASVGCTAVAATCTSGAPAVGDLLIFYAYRSGSTTAPTTPTGWTRIDSGVGANTNAQAVFCLVAPSTSTVSPSATNATDVVLIAFRGTAAQDTLHCKQVGIGTGSAIGGASSNSIAYNTITMVRTNTSSWVVGCAGHRTASDVSTAPAGMTNISSAGVGPMAACHSTNGAVASWGTASVTVNQTSGWRSFVFEIVAPCGDSVTGMCADDYVDMNTSTPGTALTTTIMNNGTVTASTDRTWIMDPSSPPGGMTVGAHKQNRLVPVTVGAAQNSFATGSASQSISYANTSNLTSVDLQFAAGNATQVTVSGWLVMGPTCISLVDNLFDLVRVDGQIGNITAVLQMNNLVGAACILNIESVISGSPNHSAGITVTGAGQTVWYTMAVDMIASTTNTCWVSGAAVGCAQLNLYDTSGAQIGSTVKIKLGASDTLGQIRYGNSESGIAVTTTFFEQSLVDYTYNIFPLGPGTATTTRQQRRR